MSNRLMLYIPEIEPDSFFFFYFRGSSGRSYSLRTYTSATAPPRLRTQHDFGYTADQIIELARYRESVPPHDVGDSCHWRSITERLNARYLRRGAADAPRTIRGRATAPTFTQATPRVASSSPAGNAEELFFGCDGRPLLSMADWQAQHPARHWRAGYSAMELARTWTSAEGFPRSFERALRRPPFQGLVFERGVVEHKTDVPGKGKASCTDLMVLARALDGSGVVLGVEGKVDESFGELVSDWISKGGVNRQDRLDGLCEGLGLDAARVGDLRYQLFHRCYAALATARDQGCEHAIVAVHSLQGRGASGENWRDFVKFARAMGAQDVTSGRPISVGERMGVRFWLLWVTEGRG